MAESCRDKGSGVRTPGVLSLAGSLANSHVTAARRGASAVRVQSKWFSEEGVVPGTVPWTPYFESNNLHCQLSDRL